MQKILLNKPVLFLLYGFPGSGKTFFARQFSKEIRAANVSSDQLRNEFFEEPNYSKKENQITDYLSIYMVNQFLDNDVSVIYDGDATKLSRRRMLSSLAKQSKAEVIVVWFQIDIESTFNRVVSRDRRTADDKYARGLDRTTFEDEVKKMQNPTNYEEYVVASGKHTFITQKNSVMKKLYEKGLLSPEVISSNVVKPELINRIPNPLAGRVDPSRRNISIR